MTNWVERIPAMIEKAEGHWAREDCDHYSQYGECRWLRDCTEGEVALAKALWAKRDALMAFGSYDVADSPALRSFAEKVDKLDNPRPNVV